MEWIIINISDSQVDQLLIIKLIIDKTKFDKLLIILYVPSLTIYFICTVTLNLF